MEQETLPTRLSPHPHTRSHLSFFRAFRTCLVSTTLACTVGPWLSTHIYAPTICKCANMQINVYRSSSARLLQLLYITHVEIIPPPTHVEDWSLPSRLFPSYPDPWLGHLAWYPCGSSSLPRACLETASVTSLPFFPWPNIQSEHLVSRAAPLP
jgi:hypothetical protein